MSTPTDYQNQYSQNTIEEIAKNTKAILDQSLKENPSQKQSQTSRREGSIDNLPIFHQQAALHTIPKPNIANNIMIQDPTHLVTEKAVLSKTPKTLANPQGFYFPQPQPGAPNPIPPAYWRSPDPSNHSSAMHYQASSKVPLPNQLNNPQSGYLPQQVPLQGGNLMLQGGNLMLQGGNVLQGGNMMLQGGNMLVQGGNMVQGLPPLQGTLTQSLLPHEIAQQGELVQGNMKENSQNSQSQLSHSIYVRQGELPPPPQQILLKPPANEALKRSIHSTPIPMSRSLAVENGVQPQQLPAAFVKNTIISSGVKKTKAAHLTVTNEAKAELDYAYFLLKCKTEELIAWKKHAKHLETHLTESVSKEAVKFDSTAIKGLEKGLFSLIEENKRVLGELANQRDRGERAKKAGHTGPEPHPQPIIDPVTEERNLELTRRVRELEGKLGSVLEENKKLNVVISEKSDLLLRIEAEMKGGESSNSERNASLNKEIVRLQEIIRKKDLGIEEMKQNANKFNEELVSKGILEGEVRRLSELVVFREKEIVELRNKQRNEPFSATPVENSEYVRKEYEERISVFTQQLERLKEKLKEKSGEIDRLSLKNVELESTLRSQESLETEITRLSGISAQKMQENEAFRKKIMDCEEVISGLKQQILNIKELEIQINSLKKENQDLNERLKKQSFVDPGEVKRLKDENQSLKENLERHFEELRSLREKIKDFELLRGEVSRLDAALKDAVFRSELAKRELEEVNGLLSQRNKELESLKIKILPLENIANSLTIKEKEIESLKKDLDTRMSELSKANEARLSIQSEFAGHMRTCAGKLEDLVRENSLFKAQLEEVKNLLASKEKEIGDLRGKMIGIDALESAKKKLELEILRLNELNANKDKDIDELRSIRKDLESSLLSKTKALFSSESSLKASEANLSEKQQELESKTLLLSEFRVKFDSLSLSIKEKLGVISQKDIEIDELKGKIVKLEGLLSKSSKFESEIAKMKEILLSKEEIISDLNITVQDLTLKLQAKDAKIAELLNRIRSVEETLKLLKSELESKTIQLSDLQAKFDSLQFSMDGKNTLYLAKDKEIQELRVKITQIESNSSFKGQYEAEIENLSRLLKQRDQELADFRSKIHSLTLEIQTLTGIREELEGKVRLLTEQNEKFKREISERLTVVNEYKLKIDSLTMSLEEKSGLFAGSESKHAFLTSSLDEMKRSLAEKENTINELKAAIADANKKISELKRMLDEKTTGLEGKLTIISELENRIDFLNGEIDKKNGLLEQRSKEITEWRFKFTELEGNFDTKSGSIAEYELKISTLNSELSRLKGLLKGKEGELEARNRELSEWEHRYHELELELSTERSRSNEAQSWKIQINQLNVRISDLNNTLAENESKITSLSSENSNLKKLLDKKSAEFDQLSLEYRELEMKYNALVKEMEELRLTLSGNSTLKITLEQLQIDIQGYLKRIKELEADVEERDNKIIELQNTVAMLSGELTRVKRMCEKQKFEIEEYTVKITNYEYSGNSMSTRISELESTLNMVRDSHFMNLGLIVTMAAEIDCLRSQKIEKVEKIEEIESQGGHQGQEIIVEKVVVTKVEKIERN